MVTTRHGRIVGSDGVMGHRVANPQTQGVFVKLKMMFYPWTVSPDERHLIL